MNLLFWTVKLIFFFFFLNCFLFGQGIGGGGESNPDLKTHLETLENWQDLRFGMFIHWGPVSIEGTEIGWSRGRDVPIPVYDNLYKQFNPVKFDAENWVRIAKDAGMKYLVITSKHHDGFALWDSAYTEYDIVSTPFHRDVLHELQNACEREQILFGTYHSIADWHHPHYTTRYGGDPRPIEDSDMSIYKEYLFNQVRELVEKYQTRILWFDGEWEDSWTHLDGMELYAFGRLLRDDILINNRVDKGRQGMQGMTKSLRFAGDFGTPEQEVGAFEQSVPWESCITIGTQWAWKPDDELKSARECIQILVRTVGGNGNLLLNVGPMPGGRIEPRQVLILRKIGDWLKVNGEGVYKTRGGPFTGRKDILSTYRDRFIYVFFLERSDSETVLPLPQSVQVKDVSLLGWGTIPFQIRDSKLTLHFPPDTPEEAAHTVRIEIDRDAGSLDLLYLE